MLEWLKKQLPTANAILNRPSMRWAKQWFLHRPYLWRFTKHSVAAGVAVSIFVAFLPLPLEMLLVTLLSLLVHGNLPISLLSTWLTNPFTLIPANYFSYVVGKLIIQENGTYVPPLKFNLHWANWHVLWQEMLQWITALGKPYLIGLPVVSISCAVLSYLLVYIIWTGVELVKARKK